MISIQYDKGNILIRGEVETPYGRWDPRVGARANYLIEKVDDTLTSFGCRYTIMTKG